MFECVYASVFVTSILNRMDKGSFIRLRHLSSDLEKVRD